MSEKDNKPFLSHSISITSSSAAGSSSTLKELKKRLGDKWNYVSGGSIMRQIADDEGITIEELTKRARENPELGYDKKCDAMIASLGQGNFTIVEARLSHYFIPQAYKVLLTCNIDTRAARRQKQMLDMTLEQVKQSLLDRDQNDKARYEKLYPGCTWQEKDFDLVIDTNKHSVEEVCDLIIENHKQAQQLPQ